MYQVLFAILVIVSLHVISFMYPTGKGEDFPAITTTKRFSVIIARIKCTRKARRGRITAARLGFGFR